MQYPFIKLNLLLISLLLFTPASFATTDENPCETALDRAERDIAAARDRQSQQMSTSSPGLYNANPAERMAQQIQQLMEKINEGARKLLEIAKQELEQNHQVDAERFRQEESLRDKERENAKEREQLPIERNNAAFELKQAQAKIRIECEGKAEEQYKALIAQNGESVGRSQYTVGSMSQARGTRDRMRSQRRLFYDRCVADPGTQTAFQMAQEAFQLKMRNLQVQTDSFLADLEHIRSKRPLLEKHMNDKERHIAEVADLERDAIDKEIASNNKQLIMAIATSAMQTQETQQAAVQFNNADQVANNFQQIRSICTQDTGNQNYPVPSDLMVWFRPVLRSCRGGSGANPCVRSSGQPSRPRGGGTTQ